MTEDALIEELPSGRRSALRTFGLIATTAYRAEPWRAVLVFVLVTVGGVGATVTSVFLKHLVDHAVRGDLRGAAIHGGLAAGVSAAVTIASWQQLRLRQPLVERTELAFEERLIDLTTSIPTIAHHEQAAHADRIEQLLWGRNQLGMVLTVLAFNLQLGLAFASTVVLLASVSPWLLLLPLSALPSLWVGRRNGRAWQRLEDDTAEPRRLARHLYELCTKASSGAEVRTFGIGPELRARRTASVVAVHRANAKVRLATTAWDNVASAAFSLGWVLAVAFVVRRAGRGEATAGDVVLCIALAADVRGFLDGVAGLQGWLLGCLRTIARVRWLEDHAAAVLAAMPATTSAVPTRLAHGIALEGVGFAYAGGEAVLRDVDLHIPAGATVAIVGENGAGKTTLVKLLCRLYEPTEGRITVDGADLATFDHVDWRARTAAVFQDHMHLELHAGEAVGVGDLPHLDDEAAIRGALDRAGGADLEAQLRDGLATPLGRSFEDGVELSGGQWQKLALGRGSLREQPLLLVLDEPTSALDPAAEHALFERFARAADRTAAAGGVTVLVSHRFSTVRMADLIVVVEGGRVVEIGSHAELVARAGTYAELFELQARTYR